MYLGILFGQTNKHLHHAWQPDDQPCVGEVGLFPVWMGATDRLLNADHKKVYFDGMPTYKGMVWNMSSAMIVLILMHVLYMLQFNSFSLCFPL